MNTKLLSAVAALVLSSASAFADPVTTYDLTGTATGDQAPIPFEVIGTLSVNDFGQIAGLDGLAITFPHTALSTFRCHAGCVLQPDNTPDFISVSGLTNGSLLGQGSFSFDLTTLLGGGGIRVTADFPQPPCSAPTNGPLFSCGYTYNVTGVAHNVPGPIAGAGLPGLIFASVGLLGWWRRRKKKPRLSRG